MEDSSVKGLQPWSSPHSQKGRGSGWYTCQRMSNNMEVAVQTFKLFWPQRVILQKWERPQRPYPGFISFQWEPADRIKPPRWVYGDRPAVWARAMDAKLGNDWIVWGVNWMSDCDSFTEVLLAQLGECLVLFSRVSVFLTLFKNL